MRGKNSLLLAALLCLTLAAASEAKASAPQRPDEAVQAIVFPPIPTGYSDPINGYNGGTAFKDCPDGKNGANGFSVWAWKNYKDIHNTNCIGPDETLKKVLVTDTVTGQYVLAQALSDNPCPEGYVVTKILTATTNEFQCVPAPTSFTLCPDNSTLVPKGSNCP